MTGRELKKMNRAELLELLLTLSRENDELTARVEQLEAELEDKRLVQQKAGSLAEEALALSGVFQAAQKAADIYLANIKNIAHASPAEGLEEERRRSEEADAESRRLLNETRRRCCDMLARTQREIDMRWNEFNAQSASLRVNAEAAPGRSAAKEGSGPCQKVR